MRIGVITLPFNPNYGWLLQAYAMQQVLKNMGHEVFLIQRKWNLTKSNSGILANLFRPIYFNINCGKLYRFYRNNLQTTSICRSDEEIRSVVERYGFDAVIVGSDQVWRIENTRGVGYNFFLDFVSYGKKKISYAASFGSDEWKGDSKDNEIIKNLLSDFSAISVREESGVNICASFFDKKTECVLDPTFLLTKEDYDRLLSNPDKFYKSKLLATYILDPSPEKNQFINIISKEKGLTIETLFLKSRKGLFHIYKSMENWLLKIRNAEYVVVDSFHGMVFCIIFHKQFVVIANKQRGNTRFENVLSKLGLEKRLVNELTEKSREILYSTIDYDKVNKLLVEEKKKSFDYLTKALL